MTTSKEYKNNLHQETITPAMLADCIYSMDQRLLNCIEKGKLYDDPPQKGSGMENLAYVYPIIKKPIPGKRVEILLHERSIALYPVP